MAIKDCIDEIRKMSAADDLSDEDIHAIADEIQRRAANKRARDKLLSQKDALDEAAEDFTKEADIAAKIEARNKAINIVTRAKLDEFMRQAVDAHGLRPDEAIRALNVGIEKKLPGGHLSVDARTKALTGEYVGGLVADLERAGLWEFLSRRMGLFGRDAGALDRDIAKAMWSIRDGKSTADGISVEAAHIGEIFHKWQEAARLRSNRAGAFIREAPGYIMRQSHDPLAITRAGREDWTAFTKPLLDAEQTFGASDPDRFLSTTYSALSSGEFVRTGAAQTDLAFKGPGNLARRISKDRTLHFKDAESFLAYNDRFGTKNLIEGVFSGLQKSAQDTALMETWGTNPRAMFDDVRDAFAKAHRDDHPEWSRKLHDASLDNQFKEVDGTTRIANNLDIARWAGGFRALSSMSHLGFSTLSSLPDIATAAAELRWQGENLGRAYSGVLSDVLKGRSSAEQRALAAEIGVGIEGALGDAYARFSSTDGLPGQASKLMRLYFKANLLSWWTDAVKGGAGKMMAFRAAEQAGKSWAKVDGRFRDALSGYGIDEAKWDIIRQGKLKAVDGKSYLTPDGVRSLPDAAFDADPRKAQGMRDELSTALQAFYTDRTDSAVITPGAHERAILNQGTQRGTWLGEGLRFIAQFKSFPLSFATKVFGRELNGLGLVQGLLKGRGDILGLAHTIAATTAMGMIALEAKEVLKGHTPLDPFGEHWAGAWGNAMTQGGGLGIYGDYLLGDFSSYGSTPLETAAGPYYSNVAQLLKIYSDARQGQKSTAGEAIRFARDNTPGANLFYVKAALDYLVLYHLQEMASPGYLRRTEQNLKKNTGQGYIFPPSQYAVGQ